MSSSLSLLFNSSTTPFTDSLTSRSNKIRLFSDCLPFPFQPHPNPPLNIKPLSCSPIETSNTISFYGNNNNNNHNNNNNGGDNGGWWSSGRGGGDGSSPSTLLLFLCLGLAQSQLGCALAKTPSNAPSDYEDDNGKDVVWEIRRGKWIKLLPNPFKDDFEIAGKSTSTLLTDNDLNGLAKKLLLHCKDLCVQLMLPNGYPHSVTGDYMEYSLWRGVQGVASQVSGVLATQALLYAVGLGKGAIPVAAAINWVLKDGIGYLSKILLSKYGRHFDVNPKGWRLFADLLENAAFGMEILTPAFPHLFVPIGAAAGAGRSAAALIQAATRSCFFAGFAAQRNFAEVIAKGEAQGMVSKFIGIMLGIALANCVGSSTPLSLATFTVVTGIHMFCNLKSYQAIILRTLNPYRASLVFSEYLLSGQVPQTKEVNDEEPLFPALPLLSAGLMGKGQPQLLSVEAKEAAVEIERRLQMGSKLSEIVNRKDDAIALFDLYRDEGYILAEYGGRFCVVLKEGLSPQDMLKSMFHVNYLYWLEKNVGVETQSVADDCRVGGRLQSSLDYVQREFNHIKHDGNVAGWVMDGLIAQPLPYRIKPGYSVVSAPIT